MNGISSLLGLISNNLTSPVSWVLNNVKNILEKRNSEKVNSLFHIFKKKKKLFKNNFQISRKDYVQILLDAVSDGADKNVKTDKKIDFDVYIILIILKLLSKKLNT